MLTDLLLTERYTDPAGLLAITGSAGRGGKNSGTVLVVMAVITVALVVYLRRRR